MSAAAYDKRWTLEHPELGTGPIPVEPYISEAYFELEREKVFRHTWLNVGRVEEIPNPGDYIVRQIAVCRTSVLIVRGKDGRIRGFYNVCVHRGNTLVWDDHGCSPNFACKYHGWTYTAEGKLIGVPEEEMFFDFDKAEHSLVPVATDVWEGFIFINLNRNPEESLLDYLGDVVHQLQGYPFDAMPVCYSYKADLNCNWKVIVDSQQEGYHAKMLHRRSLPGYLTNKENPSRHALDIQLYGRHHMISYFGNRNRKPTPLEALAHQFGTSVTKRDTSKKDFVLDPLPPGVNPARSENWAFDEYVIFPNFHVLVFFGMYITHQVWPVTVGRAIWEARAYLMPASNPAQWFSHQWAKVMLRDAWLEDGSTLEATQKGITSGAITHFILQDQELLIRNFHKVLKEYIEK